MRASILGGLLALFLYSTAGAQFTLIHTYDGTLPATGNETVPQNAFQVVIELYGGGGGGGVSGENFSLARGGGGGGYSLKTISILPSDWGKTLAYRRAEKADGGSGPFASSGQSGDYSFVGTQNLANGSLTTPVIANGGGAGTTGSGGAGGTASGGDTNLTGGDADSTGAGGNAAGPLGGTGGAVPTGSGAGDGNALGGGGAGGAQILGGSGGTGRLGRVIFTWTVTTPVPTPTPSPNLPRVIVAASRTQVREGTDSTITFSTNFPMHPDLPVNYSVSGRAILNVDYTLTPGVVIIPANQSSISIVLHSILDSARERNGEPAVITVEPGTGYFVPSNKNANRAVVLILDRKS